MSNCLFVAEGSRFDRAASRLALRAPPAPALRAATALTRPNRSAVRLPCGRHSVPTAKTVGPNYVVSEHCVEHSDHLTHHRHDHDLRLLSCGREAIVERFEHRNSPSGRPTTADSTKIPTENPDRKCRQARRDSFYRRLRTNQDTRVGVANSMSMDEGRHS
jgi:hypothetical protein